MGEEKKQTIPKVCSPNLKTATKEEKDNFSKVIDHHLDLIEEDIVKEENEKEEN